MLLAMQKARSPKRAFCVPQGCYQQMLKVRRVVLLNNVQLSEEVGDEDPAEPYHAGYSNC